METYLVYFCGLRNWSHYKYSDNKIKGCIRRVWRYQREVIRISKSKMDRQHNGQKKKDKRTNNDLQNIIHIKLKIE